MSVNKQFSYRDGGVNGEKDVVAIRYRNERVKRSSMAFLAGS